MRELDGLEDHSILTIGPAGEKGVLFASVMVGHRAAGRIGAGAVLGSKNVAALSVKGTGSCPRRPRSLDEECRRPWNREGKSQHAWVWNSAPWEDENSDRIGDLPTKNWQSNSWGKGEAVSSHFSEKPGGLHRLLQGMPHEVRAEGPRGERSLEARTRRRRIRDRGILHRLCPQRGRGLCSALRVPLQRARHRYNLHGSGHRLPVPSARRRAWSRWRQGGAWISPGGTAPFFPARGDDCPQGRHR